MCRLRRLCASLVGGDFLTRRDLLLRTDLRRLS
jgi:hypothetical protein